MALKTLFILISGDQLLNDSMCFLIHFNIPGKFM